MNGTVPGIHFPLCVSDPDPGEGKNEISCFEVLDVVFFLGLKASPVAWTSFMEARDCWS
jgi:hypothetical protein